MKHSLVTAVALAAITLLSANAFAQTATDGPWLVRVRAVGLNSANSDSTGLGLSINNKTIPEVDITYFFNKNVAAELILTVPQKHTLSSRGTPIGSLRHLPPTLTAQYHFDGGAIQPYVGAGINFTQFSSVTLPPGVGIKTTSWGPALQVGVDIPLSGKLSLNFDLKKVWLGTTVNAGAVSLGKFKVDPVLFGVGLGYRF